MLGVDFCLAKKIDDWPTDALEGKFFDGKSLLEMCYGIPSMGQVFENKSFFLFLLAFSAAQCLLVVNKSYKILL